ncbi:MAG TPA: HD-GYP domain-containing protein [Anaerolineaceae bacterium]|nr:HD-GYP domain-containing protein [Anaerolineaceae bacterium]
MAPGLLPYTILETDLEKRAPASSPARGLPSYVPLLTAILDELQAVLQVEAIAFVRRKPLIDELSVEISRGTWNKWAGMSARLDAPTSGLLSRPGELHLTLHKGWKLSINASMENGRTQPITHVPLFYGVNFIGAIWIPRTLASYEPGFRLLQSMQSIITETLYSAKLNTSLETGADDSIQSLVRRLANWDIGTFNHSLRTVRWAEITALTLGCPESEAQIIGWSGLLHDIGKMGIPRSILHKPGPLTEDEWKVMKLHPGIGSRLIAMVPHLAPAAAIVGSHHEKFDGTGYPNGLKGDQIPIGARIIAVIDAYAAMTEERAYKNASPHETAVQEILDCSGRHFDPQVSAAFINQFL